MPPSQPRVCDPDWMWQEAEEREAKLLTRTARVNLRLSEADKTALAVASASVGLTLSAFLVMAGLKEARALKRSR